MTESHDVEKNFLKTYNLPLHVHCTAVIYLPKKLLILESVILRFSSKTVWLCAIKRIKCVITKIQIFLFYFAANKTKYWTFSYLETKTKTPRKCHKNTNLSVTQKTSKQCRSSTTCKSF